MLVFLSTQGLNPFAVASVASLGQVAGMVGAVITPRVIEKYGLNAAALILLTCQIVCVGGVAAMVFESDSAEQDIGGNSSSGSGNGSGHRERERESGRLLLCVVCMLTVLSRVGLWGIDLTLRQMVQQRTEDSMRVAVFGVGEALSQCVSLCLYLVVTSEVLTFSTLTLVSSFSLGGAWLCVYTHIFAAGV